MPSGLKYRNTVISEDRLASWASPPSQTEQEKCDNAVAQIKRAIDQSRALAQHRIKVFAQGSYRNNTNVRQDSDVDVCVLCYDVWFYDFHFAEGLTKEDVGLVDSPYSYRQFKNDVHAALNEYFGSRYVTRGNKAFDIHETSTRVDADVVACLEHRRYMRDPIRKHRYIAGTELHPDNGGTILNWPDQNYENGVQKNSNTRKRFKSSVRILKNLRNEMLEKAKTSIDAPSYLLECLAWNVPNDGFLHDSYRDDLRYILAHLFNNTRKDEECTAWGEINELKYLFRGSQPWTRDLAHTFTDDAWKYMGFE